MLMMLNGNSMGAPDPLPREVARELEAAVRSAAGEAVCQAMDAVRAAIAATPTSESAHRDALAQAALELPDRFAPVIESAVARAMRDDAAALGEAVRAGLEPTLARLEAAIEAGRDEARANASPDGLPAALLARVLEDWRRGLGNALAGAMVPHAGTLAEVAARVAEVDGKIGEQHVAVGAMATSLWEQQSTLTDIDAGVKASGDRLLAIERQLRIQSDQLAHVSSALTQLALGAEPGGVGGALGAATLDEHQHQLIAKAVEDRLRPGVRTDLAAAIAPLAAEQQKVASRAEARMNAAEVASRALRVHVKQAAKAEEHHAEKLGLMNRSIDGIGGRLAFAVEALSGHAMLIERLRRGVGMQNVLAIVNIVAALLVFGAVFADTFAYLLR